MTSTCAGTTPLTTIASLPDKTIQRSPIIDVAGIEQQQFSLGAAHELLRTLILRPSVSYTVNRFRGGSRGSLCQRGPFCHMAGRAARAGGRRAAPRLGRTNADIAKPREYDQNRATITLKYVF
jgi:hypothetical protein